MPPGGGGGSTADTPGGSGAPTAVPPVAPLQSPDDAGASQDPKEAPPPRPVPPIVVRPRHIWLVPSLLPVADSVAPRPPSPGARLPRERRTVAPQQITDLNSFLQGAPEALVVRFPEVRKSVDEAIRQVQKEFAERRSVSPETAARLTQAFQSASEFDRQLYAAGFQLPEVEDFPGFLRGLSQNVKAAVEAGDMNKAREYMSVAGMASVQKIKSDPNFRKSVLDNLKRLYIQSGRPEAEAEQAAQNMLDNLGPAQLYLLASSVTFDERSSAVLAQILGTSVGVAQEVESWLALFRSVRERATSLLDREFLGVGRYAPEFWRRMDGTERMLFLAGGGLVMVGLLQTLLGSGGTSSLLGALLSLLGGGMMLYGYSGGNILGLLTGAWSKNPESSSAQGLPVRSLESRPFPLPDFLALLSPEVRQTTKKVQQLATTVQKLPPQQQQQANRALTETLDQLLSGVFVESSPGSIQINPQLFAQRLEDFSQNQKARLLTDRILGLRRDTSGRLLEVPSDETFHLVEGLKALDADRLLQILQRLEVDKILDYVSGRAPQSPGGNLPSNQIKARLFIIELSKLAKSADPKHQAAVRNFLQAVLQEVRKSEAEITALRQATAQPAVPPTGAPAAPTVPAAK